MMLLLLSVIAAPQPQHLIWNVSPSPHGDYVACDDASASVCVPDGEWWGVCKPEQFGPATTIKSGTVKLDGGKAKFSGCEFYIALISKQAKLDASRGVVASGGCEARPYSASPIGKFTAAVKMEKNGTIRFAKLDGAKNCDDAAAAGVAWSEPIDVAWPGPAVDAGKGWSVDIIGDLDNDGAAEFLLSRTLKARTGGEIAILGTPRGAAFEVIATTVTTPKIPGTPEGRDVQKVTDAYVLWSHWAGEEGPNAAKNAKSSYKDFSKKLNAALKKYPKNAKLLEMAADSAE